MKERSLPIKEAYKQRLPLLEICTGDFANPEHVVKTPVLDMSCLKKKGVTKYCKDHGMTIRHKLRQGGAGCGCLVLLHHLRLSQSGGKK